jgi:hypothetical protein
MKPAEVPNFKELQMLDVDIMADRLARGQAKRAKLAKDILDYARESLSDLIAFLRHDQTPLISDIRKSKQHDDPSTICLVAETAKKGKPAPQELFLRLLALRSLSTGYAEWMQQKLGHSTLKWGDTGHPENHGLCKEYIREKRLPDTSRTRGWFESGLKFLRIEKEVGIPGLSLTLMFALPKFQHFYDLEVSNAITMLRGESYADIIQVACRLTPLLVGYNDFYDYVISMKIPTFALSCSRLKFCGKNAVFHEHLDVP